MKRTFLRLGMILVIAQVATAQENILLIIADDVGVELIGAYNEKDAYLTGGATRLDPVTPSIDSLAEGGVLFRNAYSQPLCSPTRATILTGLYGFRNGVGGVGADETSTPRSLLVRPGTITLPRALPNYRSRIVGKWHLSKGEVGPWDVHEADALDPPVSYARHMIEFAGFEAFVGKGGNFKNVEGNSAAVHCPDTSIISAADCFPKESYLRWFKSTFDPTFGDNLELIGGCSPSSQESCFITSVTVDDAIQAMTELAPGPWFLWVGFNAIHTPLDTLPPKRLLYSSQGFFNQGTSAQDVERKRHMEALDREIGRLLSYVPANTTIIFVGDNGTRGVGNGGSTGDEIPCKHTVTECGINVPLIIKRPGMPSGAHENTELVNTTDLFDTIVEIAGGDANALDSESLVPYLDDPDNPNPPPLVRASAGGSYVYSENFIRGFVAKRNAFGNDGDTRSIQNSQYKYRWQTTADLNGTITTTRELFDVATDPLLLADPPLVRLAVGETCSEPPAQSGMCQVLDELEEAMARLQDEDGDGVAYRFDNCTSVDQTTTGAGDGDGDGFGDACDCDVIACECDFNGDKACDAPPYGTPLGQGTTDMDIFAQSYTKHVPGSECQEAPECNWNLPSSENGCLCAHPAADMSGDGLVSLLDFNLFREQYPKPGPSGLWCAGFYPSCAPPAMP